MKSALLFISLAATLLAGCATHTKEQIAAVRAAHVSPSIIDKLEHRGSLTPNDLIELKKRRVDDSVPIRQLDRVGVNYVVRKQDVKKLRDNGVSKPVVTAAIAAGDRLFRLLYWPGPGYPYPGWGMPWEYPYDPFYNDASNPYARVGFVNSSHR